VIVFVSAIHGHDDILVVAALKHQDVSIGVQGPILALGDRRALAA
jgi:hypothetical protein